jgi:hypothetical protein
MSQHEYEILRTDTRLLGSAGRIAEGKVIGDLQLCGSAERPVLEEDNHWSYFAHSAQPLGCNDEVLDEQLESSLPQKYNVFDHLGMKY